MAESLFGLPATHPASVIEPSVPCAGPVPIAKASWQVSASVPAMLIVVATSCGSTSTPGSPSAAHSAVSRRDGGRRGGRRHAVADGERERVRAVVAGRRRVVDGRRVRERPGPAACERRDRREAAVRRSRPDVNVSSQLSASAPASVIVVGVAFRRGLVAAGGRRRGIGHGQGHGRRDRRVRAVTDRIGQQVGAAVAARRGVLGRWPRSLFGLPATHPVVRSDRAERAVARAGADRERQLAGLRIGAGHVDRRRDVMRGRLRHRAGRRRRVAGRLGDDQFRPVRRGLLRVVDAAVGAGALDQQRDRHVAE